MKEIKINLRHLRAFSVVARMQNMRRAAEAIFLTQSAISLAMTKLEEEIGAQLFLRKSSGIFLTVSGIILANRVDRMLAQIEEALNEIDVKAREPEARAALASRISRAHVRALAAIMQEAEDDGSNSSLSRPSALRSLRELERVLGVRLLRDETDGSIATKACRLLFERVNVAMLEVANAIEEIDAELDRNGGTIRIGALPLSGTFVLAPVLNDAVKIYPKSSFELISGRIGQLTLELCRGKIDLIVGLLNEKIGGRNLHCDLLASFPYVLVARAEHPLANTQSVLTLQELEGIDWIIPIPGTSRRNAYNRLVSRMTMPPAESVMASSMATMHMLLSGSQRVALMTRFEFEQQPGNGDLAILPFGPISPCDSIGIIRRANWAPTTMQREFIILIRQYVEKLAMDFAARESP